MIRRRHRRFDPQGRLQLVNAAARRMLQLEDPGIGRPYVEAIRHPAIAELVAATLLGRAREALQLSPPRRAPSAHADGSLRGAGGR